MFSSTTLVCIVDLMCIVDHMCLLACNVCGGITAVAFSCCGILHLTLCGSTSGPAWYPSCPVISGKLPSSGLLHYLWFISVCWPPKRRVYTITSLLLQHRKYLLLLCCLPYLPSQGVTLLSTNVGRHSLCSHCAGYHSEYP